GVTQGLQMQAVETVVDAVGDLKQKGHHQKRQYRALVYHCQKGTLVPLAVPSGMGTDKKGADPDQCQKYQTGDAKILDPPLEPVTATDHRNDKAHRALQADLAVVPGPVPQVVEGQCFELGHHRIPEKA